MSSLAGLIGPTLAKFGLKAVAVDSGDGLLIEGQEWSREDALALVRGLNRDPRDLPTFTAMKAVGWKPRTDLLGPLEGWMNGLEECPDFVFALYCYLIDGRQHPVVYLNRARHMARSSAPAERQYWERLEGFLAQICEVLK